MIRSVRIVCYMLLISACVMAASFYLFYVYLRHDNSSSLPYILIRDIGVFLFALSAATTPAAYGFLSRVLTRGRVLTLGILSVAAASIAWLLLIDRVNQTDGVCAWCWRL